MLIKKLLLGVFLASICYSVFAETPQEKMKSCNADASKKTLKGDERKAFMKDCLSSKKEANLTAQQEKMKSCNADASKKTLKGDERKAFMKTCLSAK